MLPKTCQYCCHAAEATGSNGAILICSHKEGAAEKFFVISAKESCGNFKPGQKILRGRKPAPSERNGAKVIPLTQGKFAIVDADDYHRLVNYEWRCSMDGDSFYAFRRQGRKARKILMHRQIMRAPKGLVVDHIDRNGLNNRKSNLRLCTPAQNARNRGPNRNSSSRYKGVSWKKDCNKWYVRIKYEGRSVYLGRYDDETEAATAYDRKAQELFGEFAYLNFAKGRE